MRYQERDSAITEFNSPGIILCHDVISDPTFWGCATDAWIMLKLYAQAKNIQSIPNSNMQLSKQHERFFVNCARLMSFVCYIHLSLRLTILAVCSLNCSKRVNNEEVDPCIYHMYFLRHQLLLNYFYEMVSA